MKNRIQEKLTIRAKLKSFDQAEIVIMSVETGEVQVEIIPILIGTSFPNDDTPSVKQRRKTSKSASHNNRPKKDADIPEGTNSSEDIVDDDDSNEAE